jgi:hypothetical protein
MKLFLASIVLLVLATPALRPVAAIDLPSAPTGFSWQEIPELKAALLRPEGWFFKREESKGTLAYYITKEDIAKTGEFETGLTVNVFRLKKDKAVDRAKAMIDSVALKYHGEQWSKEVGPFQEFGCSYKVTDASGTIVSQSLAIANSKTNTMYLFIFESPETEWNSAWKIGHQIMESLALDDDV